MTYEEAVDKIINTPRFAKRQGELNKSGNDNLREVMARLGNPHLAVPSIHIAGTNGKGSTCQFVKGILNSMGYSVGVFTSPHLVKINERIELSYGSSDIQNMNFCISDDDFLGCYEKVSVAVEEHVKEGGLHLSFFELMFAMAAVYFADKKPDYVIYETGLGGRLDATNTLEPVITAITSIGLDHTDYLGNTIEMVAAEKAGIIKKDTPVIFNTGSKDADFVIENQAKIVGAQAINVAKAHYIINEITHKSIDFSCHNSYYKYQKLTLPVSGAAYQIDNAMTAITLCNKMFQGDTFIEQKVIEKGLSTFVWQGRMERIHPNVILDGAHNLDAIHRFVESVAFISKDKDISLLFAVAGDKDYRPMIDILSSKLKLSAIYITSLDSKRGISAQYISEVFKDSLSYEQKENCLVKWDDDIKVMFKEAFNTVKDTDNLLFCVGSLYLIGSIKEIAKEVLYD